MFSTKSLFAATAAIVFAGQAVAFEMPSCWSACFKSHNVTSEKSLCAAPLADTVGSCIISGCAAANMTSAGTEYGSWLCNYCGDASHCPASSASAPLSTATLSTVTLSTTYSASVPVVTPASPTGSGITMPYNNGTTTASYSKPAVSSGAMPSSSGSPSASPTPYTGGAVTQSVAGSAILLFGGLAMGLAL